MNWNYFFGWCFFFSTIALSSTLMFIINTKFDKNLNFPPTIKIIFITFFAFIAGMTSRCICYKPKDNEIINSIDNETNLLKFYEAEKKYGVV
jgi:hypothetical protein